MKMNGFNGFKIALFCSLFVAISGSVFCQTSFTRGEAFFVQNRPREALDYLEAAIVEDPSHVQAFLYLGTTYQQLDRLDDAIAIFRRVLDRGGPETARIAFNLGNAYLAKGNTSLAIQSYNKALEADPKYSAALLNRANAKVQIGSSGSPGSPSSQESLKDAVKDYQDFLSLEPRSPKAPQIQRLIALIMEEFAAQERRRLQEIAAEEQRRIAAEEAARREMERRLRLLEEVNASLQAAAEGSKSLSAGNEGVQGYEGEFILE